MSLPFLRYSVFRGFKKVLPLALCTVCMMMTHCGWSEKVPLLEFIQSEEKWRLWESPIEYQPYETPEPLD
ncbi:hypothetical protein [Absidia glauca]|uniref:Uncharacterized protein n=1 Tax=Absidia glauca TaxID=4829 RepID=A0A170ALJ7_ABSGL|nr:hypothetical protein [Absidia glauca]